MDEFNNYKNHKLLNYLYKFIDYLYRYSCLQDSHIYPPGYLSIPSDIKDPLTYYYAYNPGYKRLENIISGKLPSA